jgi:cell division septal protein FtsQ
MTDPLARLGYDAAGSREYEWECIAEQRRQSMRDDAHHEQRRRALIRREGRIRRRERVLILWALANAVLVAAMVLVVLWIEKRLS